MFCYNTLMTVCVASVGELHRQAKNILENIPMGCNLICLYGPMGAGKTTFVQGLGRALGLKARIISPTFILMRQYQIQDLRFRIQDKEIENFWHADLYRLNNIGEVKALGIQEIWADKSNLVVIEWAEKIRELLPAGRVDIHIKVLGGSKRELKIDEIKN